MFISDMEIALVPPQPRKTHLNYYLKQTCVHQIIPSMLTDSFTSGAWFMIYDTLYRYEILYLWYRMQMDGECVSSL